MGKNVARETASGFTIIEVMLFLAITGMLFAGLLGGYAASLSRQRYNDAVQGVVDDFRKIYSSVSDVQIASRTDTTACYRLNLLEESPPVGSASPQLPADNDANTRRGRSNCVVYGVVVKIVTTGGSSSIQATQLIGRDTDFGPYSSATSGVNLIEDLKKLNANNISIRRSGGSKELVGTSGVYKPLWGASLSKADCASGSSDCSLNAALLIARSPSSGAIHTYAWETTSGDGFDDLLSLNESGAPDTSPLDWKNGVNAHLNEFEPVGEGDKALRFCVESGDAMSYGGHKRMIQISSSAGRSSSSVELIDMDSGGNKCN
ncbi:prepilin-type N-terminal cleavage/methylation domain-containing protein [Candidatus Saccharibacteria bacterium]|nr:prepilin-type N-terminal cleavage/methylation domain-containing protein [Candidatus Saccharibacteria bacterium]